MPQQESVLSLIDAIPCREIQIRQLATIFCQPSFVSPSTTIVYGVESTGKSLTVSSVLESCCNIRHALVHSADWMDTGELLEAIIVGVTNISIENGLKASMDPVKIHERIRWDDLTSFYNKIRLLLEGKGHTILVLDGIDRQREAWQTLLPAMSRLGEIIANLSVILVVTTPPTQELHNTGIPNVHFPPYTRAESIHIVSFSYFPLGNINVSKSEADWLRTSFCGIVWDSVGQAVARDIVAFRNICHRLWKPFVKPIVQGEYAPRDLDKLLIKGRPHFQSDRMIEPEIVPWASTSDLERLRSTLPLLQTYLLTAAYLASHTTPRTDCLRFSKFHQYKHKRKAHSRGPRSSHSHRRMPCYLRSPINFPADRLYAIYNAILPSHLYWSDTEADLDEAVVDLCGKGLLLKSVRADYFLGCRWRVAVDLNFVTGLAKEVGFDFDEYLWD